jgi:hypothetical protein
VPLIAVENALILAAARRGLDRIEPTASVNVTARGSITAKGISLCARQVYRRLAYQNSDRSPGLHTRRADAREVGGLL